MASPLGNRKNRVLLGLWLLEMSILAVSVSIAARLRFRGDPESYVVFAQTAPLRTLLVAVAITLAMAAFGLYQAHVRHDFKDLLLRLTLSFAFGGVALLVLYYLLPQTYIGRGVLLLSLGLGFVGALATRVLAQRLFRFEAFKRRILVLGAGCNARLINERLRRSSDRDSFRVLGFVPLPGQEALLPAEQTLSVEPGELYALAERLDADEIVIAPDERRGGLPMEELLTCVQRGIDVTTLSSFFEREAGLIKLSVADPSWLVLSGGFDHSLPRRLSKRFFDLVAALSLLAVTWPFMLAVALAIRLESSGPVLYRQVRVGERGRTFSVIKFRSMRTDAESDGKARWADRNDDRVTRVGRFIRKTRLDELPQLFNVLIGQMSFVGPRPERPQFVEQLNQEIRYYNIRHSVKPGLTGWAQLRYPYGASVRDAEEKLKFDLFYVKNHGIVMDLMILLQTVEVVLFGRGAR